MHSKFQERVLQHVFGIVRGHVCDARAPDGIAVLAHGA